MTVRLFLAFGGAAALLAALAGLYGDPPGAALRRQNAEAAALAAQQMAGLRADTSSAPSGQTWRAHPPGLAVDMRAGNALFTPCWKAAGGAPVDVDANGMVDQLAPIPWPPLVGDESSNTDALGQDDGGEPVAEALARAEPGPDCDSKRFQRAWP